MPLKFNTPVKDPDAATVLAFKEALPLTVKDQSGNSTQFVSLYHVHGVLGVSTAPRTWFQRLVHKYKFEEGVDFITTEIDTSTPEGRAQLKSGARCNFFMSSDMAKEVCMVQGSDIGRAVRKYFLAAERVAKKYAAAEFAKEISGAKNEAAMARRDFLEGEKACAIVAKQHGHKTVTGLLLDAHAREKMGRLEGAGHAHEQAALLMWEEASNALKYLKAGKGASAMMALDNIDLKFGSYSDLIRHEPPWTT